MNIKSIGFVTAVGAAAVAIGTGIATAQPDNGEGTPITGEALTKAGQAALAFTGGGTVTGTEVGDEESLYEVEVTWPTAARSMSSSTTPSRWSVARPTGPARTPNPTLPAMRAMNGTGSAGRQLVICTPIVSALSARAAADRHQLAADCIKVVRNPASAPTSACRSRRK